MHAWVNVAVCIQWAGVLGWTQILPKITFLCTVVTIEIYVIFVAWQVRLAHAWKQMCIDHSIHVEEYDFTVIFTVASKNLSVRRKE